MAKTRKQQVILREQFEFVQPWDDNHPNFDDAVRVLGKMIYGGTLHATSLPRAIVLRFSTMRTIFFTLADNHFRLLIGSLAPDETR